MRNFGLDIARAVSIWMVLIMHMGFASSYLQPYGLGGYGVEVFFVLSGYLIGGILLRTLELENSLRSISRFWVRRWFRILPLYYLCLGVKYLLVGPRIGADVLYYVFFLQNHFYGVQFYGVTWSLVVEEWFYIVAPLFIASIIYLWRGKSLPMFLSMAAFILLSMALRSYFVLENGNGFYGVYGNVPMRFDSLFIGVLLAFLKRSYVGFYNFLSGKRVFIISIVTLVCLIIFNALVYEKGILLLIQFNQTIGFVLLSTLIAILIPFMERIDQPTKKDWSFWVYKLVTWTSLLTYGLYLIHPLVFSVFQSILSEYLPIGISNLILIGLTYFIALLAYIGVERPFLLLRDKITLEESSTRKYEL